ncbi:MAG: hypothetical protein Q9209_007831 [Squamulea sp. 1 TL-2023]
MDADGFKPFILSPIDSIMPRVAVNRLLFFPSSDRSSDMLSAWLKLGLARLFQQLPILTGTVKLSSSAAQKGRLEVSGPWHKVDDVFMVQNAQDLPDFEYVDFRNKHFPTRRWDQETNAIFRAGPSLFGLEQPVFRAKLTFVRGGMVFTMAIHHCFTDGNGIATLSRLWCSLCQNESPSVPLDPSIISRDRLEEESGLAHIDDIPDLVYRPADEGATPMDGSVQRVSTLFERQTLLLLKKLEYLVRSAQFTFRTLLALPFLPEPAVLPPKQTSEVLFFPKEKLKELKTILSAKTQSPGSSSWISTHDAIVSLIWCSYIAAQRACHDSSSNTRVDSATEADAIKVQAPRNKQHPEHARKYTGKETVMAGVVINARRLLDPPLSPQYIGNVLLCTGLRAKLDEVRNTEFCISSIAFALRHHIHERDSHYFKRYLSTLGSVDEISRISRITMIHPDVKPGLKLTFSSWKAQDTYNHGWEAVFGVRCDRVRVFGGVPVGLAIIMPELTESGCKSSAAGIEVDFGVPEDLLCLIKEDDMLNNFAEWR